MTVSECIEKRRSVRAFRGERPPLCQVERLIELAALAPSGGNIQPWIFILVDDPALIRAVRAVSPGVNGTPAYLVALCSDRALAYQRGGALGRDVLAVMDVSMAAENFLLAAVEMELGACAIRSFQDTLIAGILKLPEHIHPELLIALGYAEKIPVRPHKKSWEGLTHYNIWGGQRHVP